MVFYNSAYFLLIPEHLSMTWGMSILFWKVLYKIKIKWFIKIPHNHPPEPTKSFEKISIGPPPPKPKKNKCVFCVKSENANIAQILINPLYFFERFHIHKIFWSASVVLDESNYLSFISISQPIAVGFTQNSLIQYGK